MGKQGVSVGVCERTAARWHFQWASLTVILSRKWQIEGVEQCTSPASCRSPSVHAHLFVISGLIPSFWRWNMTGVDDLGCGVAVEYLSKLMVSTCLQISILTHLYFYVVTVMQTVENVTFPLNIPSIRKLYKILNTPALESKSLGSLRCLNVLKISCIVYIT